MTVQQPRDRMEHRWDVVPFPANHASLSMPAVAHVDRTSTPAARLVLPRSPLCSNAEEEFLYLHEWFDKYGGKPGGYQDILKLVLTRLRHTLRVPTGEGLGERFYTTKMALNWTLQLGGKHIVETGSLREPEHWRGMGCATYLFGEFAAKFGGHVWICDISDGVIDTAREATANFADHITYVCGDSVTFLDTFGTHIDLLYLDSMDCPRWRNASAAQRHNLRELQAALPKLSPHAVVLMDDNHHPSGGKTRLSKRFLRRQGRMCLFDWRQSIWVRL